MAEIVDDKSEHCVPFILKRIQEHRESYQKQGKEVPPFFLGLNGVQGAGKTTLVSTLYKTLNCPPHSLPTAILSIDDLYLPRIEQRSLAKTHPSNPLIQHRGQPSTHDIPLGSSIFTSLTSRTSNIKIPSYDKSAFNGQGDRTDESCWETVNKDGERKVEVVVFEGWCVGFRALSDEVLIEKWEKAREEAERQGEGYQGRLGKLDLQHIKFVNEALKGYDILTDRFGAFVHIDAQDTQFVYQWRLQQESALRASKGTGMSDEKVVEFVNGYYPAYELYTETLRKGIFPDQPGKQLRLVVDKSRRVREVFEI